MKSTFFYIGPIIEKPKKRVKLMEWTGKKCPYVKFTGPIFQIGNVVCTELVLAEDVGEELTRLYLDRKLRAGPKGVQGVMERRKHHPSFFLPYTSCHRLDRTFLIGDWEITGGESGDGKQKGSRCVFNIFGLFAALRSDLQTNYTLPIKVATILDFSHNSLLENINTWKMR